MDPEALEQLDKVSLIISLLRDAYGDKYVIYDGDPEAIPLFNLPALIVEQKGDETSEGAWGQDDVEDQFVVKVVMNKRDDMSGDKVDPLDMTARKIRAVVGERDPLTNNYAVGTIKHILRTKLPPYITAIAPTMSVEYGITPRPGDESFADLTAEGHVTFSITYVLETNQQ